MKRAALTFVALLAILAGGPHPAIAADLRNVLTDYVLTSWNNKESLPPVPVATRKRGGDA